ncbi:MAG: TatD family hydrolase [archaeon]
MIDVHCHLEQKDYNKDREDVINRCRKELKAVITSAARFKDFNLTLSLAKEYPDFVFAILGLHPADIKELDEKIIADSIDFISQNKEKIVAVGEVGLDYYWIKEQEQRKRQKKLFERMIKLAKAINKPLVIHSREAGDETLDILQKEKAGKVLLHLFNTKEHIQRVIESNYSISIGPAILKSKDIRKIARDMPLEKIMLETDSPWFGFGARNTPLAIRKVAEEIAKIRKLDFEEVWKTTGGNAINFFNLPLQI